MPCVFRIVFVSALTGQMGLAENILFFINFQNKFQLLFSSLIHIFLLLRMLSLFISGYPALINSHINTDFDSLHTEIKYHKRKTTVNFYPGC